MVQRFLKSMRSCQLKNYGNQPKPYSGVIQLNLKDKIAMLSPGRLSYTNQINNFLIRVYSIAKIIPHRQSLKSAPPIYTIDLRNMYSHPQAILCEPGDFQSIYYCVGTKKPEKGQKIANLSDEEDDDESDQDQKKKHQQSKQQQKQQIHHSNKALDQVIQDKIQDQNQNNDNNDDDDNYQGRSKALQQNQLQGLYDDYQVLLHNQNQDLKQASKSLSTAFPILYSNKTSLYRITAIQADKLSTNQTRSLLKEQGMKQGRFVECKTDQWKITLLEINNSQRQSLFTSLNNHRLCSSSILMHKFGYPKKKRKKKDQGLTKQQTSKLRYEQLDPRQMYLFNTREKIFIWSGKQDSQGIGLMAGISFLSQMNWKKQLSFGGQIQDIHSTITMRSISFQTKGQESRDFRQYFTNYQDKELFNYCMLRPNEGERLEKAKKVSRVSQVQPKKQASNQLQQKFSKMRKQQSNDIDKKNPSFVQAAGVSTTNAEDDTQTMLRKQLTFDFLMKRQVSLPVSFSLLARYSMYSNEQQVKITFQTDQQWRKLYPNLDILYSPRDIFYHPLEKSDINSKSAYLSRFGGSTVDSLVVYQITSAKVFRKLQSKDIGKFDSNKAYFILAVIKQQSINQIKNLELTNSVIYLWRGENASVGRLDNISAAIHKFQTTEFKQLSTTDRLSGIRRSSTMQRESTAGQIRASIMNTQLQVDKQKIKKEFESVLDKSIADQLHPSLLAGVGLKPTATRKPQKKQLDQSVSILTPIASKTTNPANLMPFIDQQTVLVSMRCIIKQDCQPLHFLLLFRGEMIIRTNDYGVVDNDGVLFQLIGPRYISQRARQVPVTYSQLSTSGLFLLFTPDDTCHFWIGKEYYQQILSPLMSQARQNAQKLGIPSPQIGIEHLISHKLFLRIMMTLDNFTIDLQNIRVIIMLQGGETQQFLEYMQATSNKSQYDDYFNEEEDDDALKQLQKDFQKMGPVKVTKMYQRKILPIYSPYLKTQLFPTAPRFFCVFRDGQVLLPAQGLLGGSKTIAQNIQDDQNTNTLNARMSRMSSLFGSEIQLSSGQVVQQGIAQYNLRTKVMQKQIHNKESDQFFKNKRRFHVGKNVLEVSCIVKGPDQGAIIVVDVGSEVFVWVGSKVSNSNKAYALPLAVHLLQKIEAVDRRDLQSKKRKRLFVRKNSADLGQFDTREEDMLSDSDNSQYDYDDNDYEKERRAKNDDDDQQSKIDDSKPDDKKKDEKIKWKKDRVSINLVNSGYEPVIFLKLIGVQISQQV